MEPERLSTLVEEYRILAIATETTQEPKPQRRWFKRLHVVYKVLREDPEGRAAIRLLVSDGDPHVRLCAASHCLAWWPEEARKELEKLSEQATLGGLAAEYTLKEFDKGSLTFDF